jgi:hypothetical protein
MRTDVAPLRVKLQPLFTKSATVTLVIASCTKFDGHTSCLRTSGAITAGFSGRSAMSSEVRMDIMDFVGLFPATDGAKVCCIETISLGQHTLKWNLTAVALSFMIPS